MFSSALVLLMMLQNQHVKGCISTSCDLLLTESSGHLTSPCYPQKYPNSVTCRWTIQAPAGSIVQLSFLDFDLEEAPGCVYDSLVVSTGHADVRFCGPTASSLTLNSSTNLMELHFMSDFSVQKRGFMASYRHVTVALRNKKVAVAGVMSVSGSITFPTLSQLTVCFELERNTRQQKEWLFSYTDHSGITQLGLGWNQSGMVLVVGGVACSLESIVTPGDFCCMRPGCVLWTSAGTVAVFLDGNYRVRSCSTTRGLTVPGGGRFRLGGPPDVDGNIYNLRLWNFSMTPQQLSELTCRSSGNVLDWDNSYWDVPAGLAQTDNTLSCSVSSPTNTPVSTGCDAPGSDCPDVLFYRIWMLLELREPSQLSHQRLERVVSLWLNETFQNWTHEVDVDAVSLSDLGGGVSCRALLLHYYVSNQSLDQSLISARISSARLDLVSGLMLHTDSIMVSLVENCAEENPLHYRWSETRPGTSRILPCFPNKDQTTSRSCLIDSQNYSSYWSDADFSNCTDIDDLQVSAENAAQVAQQLVFFSDNPLTSEEVSKVVNKLHQIVFVAHINVSLASTVVSIISNVLSSETSLVTSSERALRMVEDLVQRVEFEGPFVSITSRHLSVGILTFNVSSFNGSTFSAFRLPNTSDPQISFDVDTDTPLAQVVLPPSLLSGVSLDPSSRTRIHFLFFDSVRLFQGQPGGQTLSSFVVSSSVSNLSISGLTEPVQIQVSHLSDQPPLSPLCVFWDFYLDGGAGGWSSDGCRLSSSNHNFSICLCDHLTHFGVLMDISGVSLHMDARTTRVLTFVSYVGCGVSAVFSAATLLTYSFFEKLRRDYPSKILMNLSASLLLLNLLFLLDGWVSALQWPGACVSVALLLHYFLLTSFTWMGLESVHMYIALVKVFNTYVRRYMLKFCLLGWGVPALLVGVVVAVSRDSYGPLEFGKGAAGQQASEFCWITSSGVFYSTCVVYFCLIFLLNVAMFVVVMMQICGRSGRRGVRDEVLRNLRSVVSLTFLLGMTWGFALFAWGPVSVPFLYLFAIFNSLQGFFIFVFHCLLKENVQTQWRRILCCRAARVSETSDSRTVKTQKLSSDQHKSLSSSSFSTNWTSKNPFSRRAADTPAGSEGAEPNSSMLPVSQMIDRMKGYCSARSDDFYKNILTSENNCLRI